MPDETDGRSEVAERPESEAPQEESADSSAEATESQADEEGAPGAAVIDAVEQALGCRVIVYHSARTPMEKWDLRPLYGLLEAMGRQDRAALVIQSPGGSADAAHDLSSLLHDYIDDLHIYVVAYAASAATLLGLAADTLWMGPGSELSPVDPQVPIDPRMLVPSSKAAEDLPTPSEPAYVPAHVIRDFLEMTGVMDAQDPSYPRQKVHPERLEGLFEPLNPWILGWYERADKVSRRYAKDGLVNHLLKGASYGGSMTPAERADKIVHVLLDQYASHEAGIQRAEARRIGLPVSDIPSELWGNLEVLRDWYEDVLRQNVGRILETTDGVHVVPARPERECANCQEQHEVDKGFHYCPSCGSPFNIQCGTCGQALRAGWRYCPACATAVPNGSTNASG